MTGAGKEIRKERSDGIASKKASVTKFGHSRRGEKGEESREKKKEQKQEVSDPFAIRQANLRLERETRFELATVGLGSRCSTTEPLPHKSFIMIKHFASKVNFFTRVSEKIAKNCGTGADYAILCES